MSIDFKDLINVPISQKRPNSTKSLLRMVFLNRNISISSTASTLANATILEQDMFETTKPSKKEITTVESTNSSSVLPTHLMDKADQTSRSSVIPYITITSDVIQTALYLILFFIMGMLMAIILIRLHSCRFKKKRERNNQPQQATIHHSSSHAREEQDAKRSANQMRVTSSVRPLSNQVEWPTNSRKYRAPVVNFRNDACLIRSATSGQKALNEVNINNLYNPFRLSSASEDDYSDRMGCITERNSNANYDIPKNVFASYPQGTNEYNLNSKQVSPVTNSLWSIITSPFQAVASLIRYRVQEIERQ